MPIEKKSLFSKNVRAAKINAIQSRRRVDLRKPAPSRVWTLTVLNVVSMASSGKHIKDIHIDTMRASGDAPPPPPPPPPPGS